MLGPTRSLARIQSPVRVHLALEPSQEGRPCRSRVRRGVRNLGVQVVGCHAGPQRPTARGGRRLRVPFPPAGGSGVSPVTSALSLGTGRVTAH